MYAADSQTDSRITPIGRTDWRNSNQPFGIKDADRLGHLYCIGKTGTGKSTLLLNMAISDVERGKGLCVIDPHGDLAETILHYVPERRIRDVIYFNAADEDYAIAFNPLAGVRQNEYSLVASAIVGTFKKVWADSWGPRLEHILRHAVISLLHYPTGTLLDIQRLLTDPVFRSIVLAYVSDTAVLSFWRNEFEKYAPGMRSEVIAPILNKTGILAASPILRGIVGRPKSSFQMKDVLDSSKILICNLAKGRIGEDVSAFLGAMILTAIQSAAFSRAQGNRTPFYIYVDEMQSFVTLSFVDVLAEARKYGLSLFMAHQYIEQLDERIRSAVFGNVGTLISFRVGAADAEYLAREFHPLFKEDDLVNLPRYSMYLKLMIDGATSKPFSATTLQIKTAEVSYKQGVIDSSRKAYATGHSGTHQPDTERSPADFEPGSLFG